MVQGEVGLLKAEMARRDSARAAQLSEVIELQRRTMDSLTATRKAVAQTKGDVANDLYSIQQQLVQIQELTGQSQVRINQLNAGLERRSAEITAAPATPGDSARPDASGANNASADQMYQASLTQLNRGSVTTARLGLREMVRLYPNSERTPDALYFIGQSFASENPDSAAAYYRQVVDNYATSPRAASATYNLGLLAERRKDMANARQLYQRVAEKYPQSNEAALARDRLKALGR